MKLMVVLFVTMIVGIIAFAEITPNEKPSAPSAKTEMSQMRDEINRLKAKVELLEYRARSLESSVEQLKRSPVPAPLTLQAPAPSGIVPRVSPSRPPTIWGQGEVNGWTYYIVPCQEQGR